MRFFDPGVQFFPVVVQSASRTVSFTGSSKHSAAAELANGNGVDPFPNDVSPVVYDFGDGTTLTGPPEQFDHTFPGPGSYTVRATTDDRNGKTRTYSTRVVIDTAPQARMTIAESGGVLELRAGIAGGDGNVLGAHWEFGNGDAADGLRASHDALPAGTSVTVTIVDGSGDVATLTQTL
jgi:chitodextrinase